MRILFVFCALLAIAVTSLARPKSAEDANDKTTTALPLVITTKDKSLNNTQVESSNEKLASTIANTTPTVTTADKPKDLAKADVNPGKAFEVITSNVTIETTTVIVPTKKISPNTEPVTTTTVTNTTVATTVVPVTKALTTQTTSYPETTTTLPPVSVCPPLPGRHFDGLSFLGGIILTICLIGVGVFLCKYCQTFREDKYCTL